ncbi:hypothetical protein FA09DRAFT_62305 [Tilletiopsis washingtonensis]|jgi:hypothetical protein|uniref:Uncharacterized protein n=1 Tax=Tilletiopsis washingtonensis TaxID=58919 RepID=A0A316Z5T6_9BASI|nr:hypothetical protein FA09DRAFT_62305 [Tilletiopsis washingtonensis]PWN97147.1 hypothetical protein FA09DRAFT_62305 [Tilletiopsis washingtonensis]
MPDGRSAVERECRQQRRRCAERDAACRTPSLSRCCISPSWCTPALVGAGVPPSSGFACSSPVLRFVLRCVSCAAASRAEAEGDIPAAGSARVAPIASPRRGRGTEQHSSTAQRQRHVRQQRRASRALQHQTCQRFQEPLGWRANGGAHPREATQRRASGAGSTSLRREEGAVELPWRCRLLALDFAAKLACTTVRSCRPRPLPCRCRGARRLLCRSSRAPMRPWEPNRPFMPSRSAKAARASLSSGHQVYPGQRQRQHEAISRARGRCQRSRPLDVAGNARMQLLPCTPHARLLERRAHRSPGCGLIRVRTGSRLNARTRCLISQMWSAEFAGSSAALSAGCPARRRVSHGAVWRAARHRRRRFTSGDLGPRRESACRAASSSLGAAADFMCIESAAGQTRLGSGSQRTIDDSARGRLERYGSSSATHQGLL